MNRRGIRPIATYSHVEDRPTRSRWNCFAPRVGSVCGVQVGNGDTYRCSRSGVAAGETSLASDYGHLDGSSRIRFVLDVGVRSDARSGHRGTDDLACRQPDSARSRSADVNSLRTPTLSLHSRKHQ